MKTTKSMILERLKAPKSDTAVENAGDEGRDLVRKVLAMESVDHKAAVHAAWNGDKDKYLKHMGVHDDMPKSHPTYAKANAKYKKIRSLGDDATIGHGIKIAQEDIEVVEEGDDSVKHKMQQAAVQHHREWADHHSGNMWFHSKDDESLADKHLRANSAHHKAAWSHASGHPDAMKHSDDAEKASDVAHKASRKKVESVTVAHESVQAAMEAAEKLVLESRRADHQNPDHAEGFYVINHHKGFKIHSGPHSQEEALKLKKNQGKGDTPYFGLNQKHDLIHHDGKGAWSHTHYETAKPLGSKSYYHFNGGKLEK